MKEWMLSKGEVQWKKSSFIYIPISTDDSYQQYSNLKGLREVLDKTKFSVGLSKWWRMDRSMELGWRKELAGKAATEFRTDSPDDSLFFITFVFLWNFLFKKVTNLVISSKPG